MPRRVSEKRNETKSVRAVDRAIEILQAFSIDKPLMSVLDIQKKVRLSRPTVYRLLETLQSHNLIRVHGEPQRFSLDYGIGRLAQNWTASVDPILVGRPLVEKLHNQTKETVALAVLRGNEHFYVMELKSPHVLSMSRGIGPVGHLTRGATGKTILAFMNDDDREAVLRTTPKDVDKVRLAKDLSAVRANGYWVAHSEIFAGAIGIAAPYFDASNRVAGSLIAYGPEARFDKERIRTVTQQVVAYANELSVALGHMPSGERTVAPWRK